MSAASYNRGSRLLSREIDCLMPAASALAERQSRADETVRLREYASRLERDLSRARRCIAELRRSKDERLREARAELRCSDAAIRILTRIAFPSDATAVAS